VKDRKQHATRNVVSECETEQQKSLTASRVLCAPQKSLMFQEIKKNCKLTRPRHEVVALRGRVNFIVLLSSKQEKYVFKERNLNHQRQPRR
jgi:hypothetical protein